MKKLLIIHNGRPYLADGEMPELPNPTAIDDIQAVVKHHNKLRNWINSLIGPENVRESKLSKCGWCVGPIEHMGMPVGYWEIEFPQPVEVDGKRIIRLL